MNRRRFSSRHQPLDHAFLRDRLKAARTYRPIAGYFRSSIFEPDRGFGSLGYLEQQAHGEALETGFVQSYNPVVRHTVLRRRETMEEAGLLERVVLGLTLIRVSPAAMDNAVPPVEGW